MGALRVRRADAAPGVGPEEYYGRVPESVLTDRELPAMATRVYGAIRLLMSQANNQTCYLGTMAELGTTAGITERYAREMVAALEARGHVARERVRTIAGSPQAIRPLARLRGVRGGPTVPIGDAHARNNGSGCNRNNGSGQPEQQDRPPGTTDPGNRNGPSAPLKREGEETSEQQDGGSAAGVAPLAPPAPPPEEDQPPGRAGFLRSLAGDLAEALRPPAPEPPPRRAKRPRGSSAKIPPGAVSRNSVPDAKDCTAGPDSQSRPEHGTKHNAH